MQSTSQRSITSSYRSTSSMNGSKFSRQSSIISRLSPYTSMVMISFACPTSFDTALGLKSFFNRIVQYVALKSCHRISRIGMIWLLDFVFGFCFGKSTPSVAFASKIFLHIFHNLFSFMLAFSVQQLNQSTFIFIQNFTCNISV